MKKTAVVYDKWLQSLGGGEVVACNIARILFDIGYDVTFIGGKSIDKLLIRQKLDIDMSEIHIIDIWNDESKIKKISSGKDLFINLSFIDYTYGYSRKNIYYTHFPKEPYNNLRGMLVSKFLLPLASKFIKPIEFMNDVSLTSIKNNKPAYLLENDNKLAVTYLKKGETYIFEFSLFLEFFYKSLLESLDISINGAKVIEKKVNVNHSENQLDFRFKIKPESSTVLLQIKILNDKDETKQSNNVYLLYPKISFWNIYEPFYQPLYQKINSRLRAGFFSNPLERLKSYQLILANSNYTQKWIKNYWKRDSLILYPPVEMMFKKYNLGKIKKKKWICSVGRFFVLGHGKKQEILIKAFKKFYDYGYHDWQLHLVGGIGNEPTSIEFVQKLKDEVKGYPVFFHFNVSRKEVENVYLNSSVYWHAAGFGENENKNPIKFEHFGITPLEAISAKCIPILFNGGGLREIITENGFGDKNLFDSINQLVSHTIYYVNERNNDIVWDNVLQRIDAKFSVPAFKKRFIEILELDF